MVSITTVPRYVQAEALDPSGKLVGSSAVVRP
jgi:hypothetical protein